VNKSATTDLGTTGDDIDFFGDVAAYDTRGRVYAELKQP